MLSINAQEADIIKPILNYIGSLPPRCLLTKISKENINCIRDYWYWLAKALTAYFSDEPNPLINAELPDLFVKTIQNSVSKYLALSVLFFQSENLLRQEAKRQEIPYFDFDKLSRSDFIKIWAIEECLHQVNIIQQGYWESLGKRQNDERRRETIKWVNGQNSTEKMEILKRRWEDDDSKLYQKDFKPEELMPFTLFCLNVFKKNIQNLPEAKNFIKTWYNGTEFQKFTVVKGEPKLSSVRGKDRKKRKTDDL